MAKTSAVVKNKIKREKKARAMVIRTAGTNCDQETIFALNAAGANTSLIHINQLISGQKKLEEYHIIVIPGGFSYGDDIEAGRILANEMKYKLGAQFQQFVESGRLVLGICNGFQVLIKMGLLPGSSKADHATLTFNDSGKFEDRWVYLQNVKSNKCIFTKGLKSMIYLPVAHGEGKFFSKENKIVEDLFRNHQVVFKYVDENNRESGYPFNPNGSLRNIAGICNPTGNVFGLMPHPERFNSRFNHPHWTRLNLPDEGAGIEIFRNAVEYAKNNFQG